MRARRIAAGLAMIVLLGCGVPEDPAAPELPTSDDIIRQPFCTLEAATQPVAGTLAGDADDPRLVWLVVNDRRVELVWPAGFSVTFDPPAVIDDGGNVFAEIGDRLELGQVPLGSRAGTAGDPYEVRGIVNGGCFGPRS